ncbi:MAG TPA: hypothetical protein DHW42_09665 [Candidatus Marinimicrobia bacterium]|nr:hypothetical protein [Candidatus Neomarinimicrobiota bacterium]
MGYYYHKKRRRKLKNIEKKFLYIIILLSLIVALGLQVVIKGIPQWAYRIFVNRHIEEVISRSLIRGSAVRRETDLRKRYETKYRENEKDSWKETYNEILQNTRDKEIEEYQKMLEAEKKLNK